MTKRVRKNGVYKRYYDNGQILSKVHYNDGKLDGKWTFWYENGQKQLEGNYKPYEVLAEDCRAERSSPYIFPAKDSKDGKWTEWYENGQKKLEQNYKCGRVIGKWTTWDENGQKMFEGNYKDGGLPGIRFAIREGKWIVWDENGQIKSERNYKEDIEIGEGGSIITRYENGQKEAEVNWKDGKKDGKLIWWDENGQIMEEQYYKMGELKDWKITRLRR